MADFTKGCGNENLTDVLRKLRNRPIGTAYCL
jgi:hypothetical protein